MLRRFSPAHSFLNLFMVVFALTALSSLFASYDVTRSQPQVIAIFVSVALFFWIAYIMNSPRLIIGLTMVFVVVGIVFALLFILQYGNQNYPDAPGLMRSIGGITTLLPPLVFIHENTAGTLVEILLPLTLALMATTRRWLRWAWGLAIPVLLYALFLSYSRGAWVSVVFILLLGLAVVIFGRLNRALAIGLIVIGVVLVIAITGAVVTVGANSGLVQSAMNTATSRLELYRNGIYLASDYPFTGIGLGDTFAMIYSRYSLMIFVPLFTYSHNLPLAIWLGQGLLGLVAFAGIVLLFYYHVLRVIRIADPGPIFYGAWLGVTATLVHGLFDARQYVESPFTLPALFVGIGLAIGSGRYALSEVYFVRRRHHWFLPLGLAGALLGTALVGSIVFSRDLQAIWYTNMGAIREAQSDSAIVPELSPALRAINRAAAQASYEQALAINPNWPSANRRLGNLLVADENFSAGIPLLEKAYATEPGYQASIKGLGLAYLWVGKTRDAANLFQQLSEPAEMSEELWNWFSFRQSQNQMDLAGYAGESALFMSDESGEPNLSVWLAVADSFMAADNRTHASYWYTRVLTEDPTSSAAIGALTLICDIAPEIQTINNRTQVLSCAPPEVG